MPNHKSAIKRDRQSVKRRAQNRTVRSEVRSAMRKAISLAQEGNAAGAKDSLRHAESLISRAAAKGLYHPRNASRKISRLAILVSKTSAKAKTAVKA